MARIRTFKMSHNNELDMYDTSTTTNTDSLPLAELLRRRARRISPPQHADSLGTRAEESHKDVDDEIKRLEAELAESEDDSSSHSDSDSDSTTSEEKVRSRTVRFGQTTWTSETPSYPDAKEPAVICLSQLADERIQPLPTTCLPAIRRKRNAEEVGTNKKKARKEKVDGLQEAVKEVLAGYVARSAERLPFYCRVCSKQYDTKDQFFEHKNTEFHQTAVDMERKASFCKLCQKQFTSPVQLKEHLTSKPHKERLQRVRARQKTPSGRGGNRQWC
jgi:Zinc-finger of C2H2 type